MAETGHTGVTIVIPVLNEEVGLRSLLPDLLVQARAESWEILVVDDGSSDLSGHVAEELGARVTRHPRRRGYGAALKTGIRSARGSLVATMDGDGQHSVKDLCRVVSAAADADMVIGARRGLRQSKLWRMPGKWLVGLLAEYLAGESIPDLNSGLRVFKRDVVMRYLHLCPDGFSFSTTITLAFLDRGKQIDYVPIDVQQASSRSTVTVATGLETLFLLLRLATLFQPLRLFVTVGLVAIAAGILWAIPYAFAQRGISIGAALLVLTGVQVLFVGLLADQVAMLRKERFET